MSDRKTDGGKGDRIPGANQSAYEAGYAGIQWGDGVDESHGASRLKVVQFPGPDINDIPSRLRSLADLLEHGTIEGALSGLEDTRVFVWINVTTSGNIESGAMGRCHDRFHAAGVMQAAAIKLLGDEYE